MGTPFESAKRLEPGFDLASDSLCDLEPGLVGLARNLDRIGRRNLDLGKSARVWATKIE